MAGTLITTVPKSSVHALAFQGILAYASFPQIRDMLLRKFGEEYALLFAQPVENIQSGDIDWYTPVQGTPVKLMELPEEEKFRLCNTMHHMAQEIQAYAEDLIHSPEPLKVTRGHILKLALSYPDDSYLYAVGQHPVFCCWGFGPGTPGVEPRSLTRLAVQREVKPEPEPLASAPPPQAPPVPPPAPPVSTQQRTWGWSWLWWLLPLALAGLLFLLLFTSFGEWPAIAGKTLFEGPELPFLEKPGDSSAELASLQNEIAELQGKLDHHIQMCKPASPVPEKPAPAPEPPREALVIPEDAHDTSFLAGKWRCETGLANSRTGKPVVVEFLFDTDGNGTCTVQEATQKCAGTARSFMKDGQLHISHGELACERGNAYAPQSIICSNTSGAAASCTGQAPGGNPWGATFIRINQSGTTR